MFIKEFPDYKWLKERTEKTYQDPHEEKRGKKAPDGWPVIIMNAKSTFCHRPDLKGPFSIFTNISGNSFVQVDNKRVNVSEESFFISNRAQYYTLDIESDSPVETFNLHLGQDVWENYIHTCATPDNTQLDKPDHSPYSSLSEFPNLLQQKDQRIQEALKKLYSLSLMPAHTGLEFDEHLALLFQALVWQKQELLQAINRIPQVKRSTKEELHKRIALATDFILSNPTQQVSLEELAGLACLSKFHFLRIFTSIYRTTPHQFILNQKLLRSQRLLRKTNLPVGEIGVICGFPEIGSFSRAFSRFSGCSPGLYRQKVK